MKPVRIYTILTAILTFNSAACVMISENTLTGRVTDSANKPIEGATVKLEDPDPRGSKPYTRTTTTDSIGVYFLENECSGAFPNGGFCPRYFNIIATKDGFTEFRALIQDTQETKIYDIKMQ